MIANRTACVAAVLAVLSAWPVAAAWTPPIGIPAPSFGITEVAPAVPNPWTVSTAGFYYVEPTKAGATDTSNTYGTPAKPRRTIPTVLPAGAVVELHGIYDTSHSSPATIVSQGTASQARLHPRRQHHEPADRASRLGGQGHLRDRREYRIRSACRISPITGSMVILLAFEPRRRSATATCTAPR